MAKDYLHNTIKTEVEDIDCSVNNEFIQLDFNVDDPPEITDQPIGDNTGPLVGNFKCISCGLLLPSKSEYDIHQQIHHSSPADAVKRPRVPTINLADSYDPECEDVDDPNYVPHASRNFRPILPRSRTPQEVMPGIKPIQSPKPSSIIPLSEKNYKCSQCFYSTENESLIREHMAKNKHNFKYQCNYCTKSFQFVYMLNNHHKSCHKDDEPCFDEFILHELKESDNLVCSLCCHTEKNPKTIEAHYTQMHSQSPRTFSYYIENIASKSPKPSMMGNKIYVPNKDGETNGPRILKTTGLYSFSGRGGGRRSKYAIQTESITAKSDVSELFYKCVACNKWFNTHKDCKEHQSRFHPNQILQLFVSSATGGNKLTEDTLTKYYCIRCAEECYTTTEMKAHCRIHKIASQPLQYIRLIHNDEPKLVEEATYKCSQCDVMPDTLMNMQKHWTDTHPNKVFKVMKLYADSSDKSFVCKVCSKIFKHSVMLDLHQKLRHNSISVPLIQQDPDPAPIIVLPSPPKEDIRARNNVAVARTYVPPHGIAPITSTQAPMEVAKPGFAKTTIPSESCGKIVVEKYQCLYCSQSYSMFEKLKEHHIEEHSDFTWLYLYVRHMDNGSIDVISSGDKLYKCFYCNGDFGKNFSTLSVHYKEAHAPLNFKYKICEGKDGFSKWEVKEHILKITPDTPTPTPPTETTSPPSNDDCIEILPDIKPDVRELDALIAKQQESNKRPSDEELDMNSPKKLKETGQEPEIYGKSWYKNPSPPLDLDKVVIRRSFNDSSFKIAVSNIISVMNLNPSVKVSDYRGGKQQ